MSPSTPPDDTVVWTLCREHRPGMRSTWWQATARCFHGTSQHEVVAPRLELVRLQLAALGRIHQAHVRCDCTTVELVET